jgi:hypothetical protein
MAQAQQQQKEAPRGTVSLRVSLDALAVSLGVLFEAVRPKFAVAKDADPATPSSTPNGKPAPFPGPPQTRDALLRGRLLGQPARQARPVPLPFAFAL